VTVWAGLTTGKGSNICELSLKNLPLDKLDEVPASELCDPFFSNFPLDYKEINDIIF